MAEEGTVAVVLIESMFTTIQHQVEHIAGRLDDSVKWMRETDLHFEKTDNNLAALTSRVDVQNGGVREALAGLREQRAFCDSIQHGKDVEAADISGYSRRVADEKRLGTAVVNNVVHPVVLAAVAAVIFVAGTVVGATLFALSEFHHAIDFFQQVVPGW